MEFTQPLRLEFNDSRSDRLGDWKVAGVNLAESSTMSRNRLRIVLIGMINIR
jgi:hypothetical protein